MSARERADTSGHGTLQRMLWEYLDGTAADPELPPERFRELHGDGETRRRGAGGRPIPATRVTDQVELGAVAGGERP